MRWWALAIGMALFAALLGGGLQAHAAGQGCGPGGLVCLDLYQCDSEAPISRSTVCKNVEFSIWNVFSSESSEFCCLPKGTTAAETGECPVGPAGCCIEKIESPKIPAVYSDNPTCTNEKEMCGGTRGDIYYSCCVCEQMVDGTTVYRKIADERHTRTTCEAKCKELTPPGKAARQTGAGRLPEPTSSQAPTAAQLQQVNALCFTPAECASEEYGKSPEAFRPGHGCPSGKGRCIAPEPEVKLGVALGTVSTVKGFRGFVAAAFNYLLAIIATVTAIMFVYGGFRYITGSAFGTISKAKEIMVDATVGMLLVIGSYTILNTINPATLNLNALEVFMVKKEQVLSSEFCADIKPAGGESILFAEAGSAPAYTPVNSITEDKYSIEKDKTRCNYEYYAKGFGASICRGRACDDPNQACVQCTEDGVCPEEQGGKGYACVDASFSGKIVYTDKRFAEEVNLYIVCNKATDAETAFTSVGWDGLKEVAEAKLHGPKETQGVQTYIFELASGEITSALKFCDGKGGPAGFVLGIQYNDPGNFLLGILSTDAASGSSADEFAAIGKTNCGSGPFAGYMDGSVGEHDDLLKQQAILCGLHGSRVLNSSTLWTLPEIQKATGMLGDPRAITCNFEMSSLNAFLDPVETATRKAEIVDTDLECRV